MHPLCSVGMNPQQNTEVILPVDNTGNSSSYSHRVNTAGTWNMSLPTNIILFCNAVLVPDCVLVPLCAKESLLWHFWGISNRKSGYSNSAITKAVSRLGCGQAI